MEAAGRGRLNVPKLLVEKGANVNAVGSGGATALMSAASGCNPEVVKLLIDKRADLTAKSSEAWTAIIIAADAATLM